MGEGGCCRLCCALVAKIRPAITGSGGCMVPSEHASRCASLPCAAQPRLALCSPLCRSCLPLPKGMPAVHTSERAPPTRLACWPLHAGRLLFADNAAFMPGIVLRFRSVRFQSGSAQQGGAFLNTGAMQARAFVGAGARQAPVLGTRCQAAGSLPAHTLVSAWPSHNVKKHFLPLSP